MNYILILVLLIVSQNVASDDSVQQRKDVNHSFNINIGAGYAVGSDQSSNNNTPNGSSNISFPKGFYSNPLKTEAIPNTTVRGPRILTNFTPQIGNPIREQTRNQGASQTHVSESRQTDHHAAPSNIQNYYSQSFLKSDERSQEPNLVDFKKVLEKIEVKKPYSKVVQVIKVPAIYEIHLQSDKDDDVSENQISVNPTADTFWKNYYNKPNISESPTSDTLWKNYFESKPNITTQLSEEYSEWLKSNNMQREESITKEGEKYYDFSDTPIVTYENYPQNEHNPYDDKLDEKDILEPIIDHHYNHIRNPLSNFRSDNEQKINYNSESLHKPIWETKDYTYSKKPFGTIPFKKDVLRNSYGQKITSKPYHNEFLNTHNPAIRNTNPFKHNQAVTENDKPQALHEVPPPTLGKHQRTKYFEIQKVSQTMAHPKFLPTPATFNLHTNLKINKFSPPRPNDYKASNSLLDSKPLYSTVKKEKFFKSEVVPSSKQFSSYTKGNQNLIYGTKSERVLPPQEINIPVTPGTTMVTLAEKPDNVAQTSVHNFRYSASIKTNTNPVNLEKPEILSNKNSNHHKKVIDIPKQTPKKTNHNTPYKNDPQSFSPQIAFHKSVPTVPQKNTDNVFQNFQYPFSIDSINFLTTEKPQVLTSKPNNYHAEIENIPYQTQKSIADIVSTTQSSDTSLSNNFASTTQKYDRQLEQSENTDKRNIKSEDNIVIASSAPTFRSNENSRRRTFNINMDSITKNGLFDFLKNEDHPKLYHRKNNGADYIIYITRKAID